jgi:ribosome-associated protein
MIHITDTVAVEEREIKQRFVRAVGAGGENVDRDATAVELRFDIPKSSLPDDVKARLIALGGRHVTSAGVLVVVGRADRSQLQNRTAAHARLFSLLKRAAASPIRRRPTTVPSIARRTRQLAKQRQAAVKRSRNRRDDDT